MENKFSFYFGNYKKIILLCLFLMLISVYIIQVFSPLRLNYDSVDFCRMAIGWSDGQGVYVDESTRRYPMAYAIFLGILIKLGIFESSTVVLSNVLFLSFGLLVLWVLSRGILKSSIETTCLLLSAVLLSWILVKHITLPLSDVPFMGVSLLALLSLWKAESNQNFSRWCIWVFAGIILCLLSFFIRYVGICLLPGILWLLYKKVTQPFCWHRKCDKILIFSGMAIYLMFFIFLSFGFDLLPMPDSIRRVYSHEAILPTAIGRLSDLGAALLNTNLFKLQYKNVLQSISIALGAVVLFASMTTLFPRGERASVVWIYLISYLGLIFVAPWNDPRYLMPIWPLILLAMACFFRRFFITKKKVWAKSVFVIWFGVYFAMGILALGYSTWLTFSGPQFANRFGSKESRVEYLYFYGGKSLEKVRQNPRAYEMYKILDRFEPFSRGILAPKN